MEKFILSPQEQRKGLLFKVSSEGLSPEINGLGLYLTITDITDMVLTETAVA